MKNIHDMIPNGKPAISVILPVYNAGEYLLLSVESVLNQTEENFEFIILDDCSTDNSWNYLSGIQDQRITIFRNDINKGLFFNLNFLIGKCNSGLIKLWSQDDIMYPNCLATMVAFHIKHPDLGFSYSGYDIINEKGELKKNNGIDQTPEIISPRQHAQIAFFTGSIAGNISNVCLTRNGLDKVGLFSEDMKISADFDMWVRLAKDHNTGLIHESLIQLRDHKGQLSRKESLYIYHVREDLRVYKYLLDYVQPEIKTSGRIMLRNYKLVFYYTLMVKAMMKGNLRTAYAFYKELSLFDNFFKLSFSFIKNKIRKPPFPDLLQ